MPFPLTAGPRLDWTSFSVSVKGVLVLTWGVSDLGCSHKNGIGIRILFFLNTKKEKLTSQDLS